MLTLPLSGLRRDPHSALLDTRGGVLGVSSATSFFLEFPLIENNRRDKEVIVIGPLRAFNTCFWALGFESTTLSRHFRTSKLKIDLKPICPIDMSYMGGNQHSRKPANKPPRPTHQDQDQATIKVHRRSFARSSIARQQRPSSRYLPLLTAAPVLSSSVRKTSTYHD